MKHYSVFFVIALLFCFSCGTKKENDFKSLTLQVDLREQSVSWAELFSHAEIIPLETQDSCLIMDIEKLILHEGQLYVFDQRKPAVYAFDENGKFLREITEKGEGPGEYQAITDIMLDEMNERIVLLCPFGNILIYDMEGGFLEQKVLPMKPNYYSINSLSDSALVLWSCVDENETGISVIDKSSMGIIYETWHNDRMLDMGLMKPFYQYGSENYFSTAYQNAVYHIGNDSLECSYIWDFGKDNIDFNRLISYREIKNASERNNKILKDLEEGILPYAMEKHNQNNAYYYVALRKGMGFNRPWINVFYRKQDGRSYVFERTAENIHIHPILFTNEFLVSVLSFEDIEAYSRILPEKEYSKLELYSTDDNPCLVKFYFK